MSNNFKQCPIHFSREAKIFLRRAFPPCATPGYGSSMNNSTKYSEFDHNTGIQDFWGFEVCNGLGGLWGALSPKIVSIFVHLVRISHYRAYVLQFFAKHWKTSPNVSKVISHHF